MGSDDYYRVADQSEVIATCLNPNAWSGELKDSSFLGNR